MSKMKKINLEKKILLAEAVLIIAIFVYLFFATVPKAVSPIAGQIVSDPDFVFEIEEGDEVLISKTQDFVSPIILKEGEDIILPPGTYYWRVKGFLRDSEIHTFSIQGHVSLDIYKRGEIYEVENSGNVDLEVSGKNSGITTNLEIGESIDVKEDTYEGKQN